MAKFRSIGKIEKPGYVGCSGVFLLLVANFQVVGELLQFNSSLSLPFAGKKLKTPRSSKNIFFHQKVSSEHIHIYIRLNRR